MKKNKLIKQCASVFLLLACLLQVPGSQAVHAADEIEKPCDVRQGFDFDKNRRSTVGHLTSLSIGDTQLDADFGVTNPTEPGGDPQKVVAVLSHVYWGGGYYDPIHISGQVSGENKDRLQTIVRHWDPVNDVRFSFDVYDFDQGEGRYYPSFHSNGVILQGEVLKAEGGLVLQVENVSGMEVQSPENYGFTMAVLPAPQRQYLHLATGVDVGKTQEPWGVALVGTVVSANKVPLWLGLVTLAGLAALGVVALVRRRRR